MQIEGKYYGDDSYAVITRVSEMEVDMIVDYFGLSRATYESMPLTLHTDTIFIVEPNPDVNTVFVVKDTLMIPTFREMKLIKQ